jgi:DnaD/phage-associated family protein
LIDLDNQTIPQARKPGNPCKAKTNSPAKVKHHEEVRDLEMDRLLALDYYTKHICSGVSSSTSTVECDIEKFLAQNIEVSLIQRVIDEVVDRNVKNWAYVKRILNTCKSNGILTLEQFINEN